MANNEKEVVLSIRGLNKTIGKRHILHDIDMECYSGEVFGFLGPNGAGKTTTIKTVVGMLSLEDGEISICGKDVKKDFEKAMADVGGIVENPEFYRYLSGKDNLRQYARMRGLKGKECEERIDEVVNLVGLSNRIGEKVGRYSLGMRQRLGVAQALIHNPKLLVLDEPTNGLDPTGIKELRGILKNIAHEKGVCVVVSSHLMSEMELTCDRIGIISDGKMIGTYAMEQIVSQANSGNVRYEIEVDNTEKALSAIKADNVQKKSDAEKNMVIVEIPLENEKEIIAGINGDIVRDGVNLYSVHRCDNKKLEDAFIELTAKPEGDGQIG